MLTTGQIEPSSPFGQALTKYAKQSESILEVGFGSGLGSTRCLMDGMVRASQSLTATEGHRTQFEIGSVNIQKAIPTCMGHVHCLYGVFHRMVRPYWHPIGTPQHKEEYEACKSVARTAPCFVDPMFGELVWDLVVLDGGEYSSDPDFLMLWERTKIMALDDTCENVATKNVYGRNCLIKAGWKVLHDHPEDRNGWFIAERR